MISEIFTQKYNGFPVNEREVLRYAQCQGADEDSDVVKLSRECIGEAINKGIFSYNICYRVLPIVEIAADGSIDFNLMKTRSTDLAKLLCGCDNAVFMAATVGHGIDRIINKYTRLDPAKSVFMQAIGAERIESMLDTFCMPAGDLYSNVARIFNASLKEIEITPRFSPGYGDLPLGIQPEFISILDAGRKIGITLNDSLLMSPSKSVTAIAGIKIRG